MILCRIKSYCCHLIKLLKELALSSTETSFGPQCWSTLPFLAPFLLNTQEMQRYSKIADSSNSFSKIVHLCFFNLHIISDLMHCFFSLFHLCGSVSIGVYKHIMFICMMFINIGKKTLRQNSLDCTGEKNQDRQRCKAEMTF